MKKIMLILAIFVFFSQQAIAQECLDLSVEENRVVVESVMVCPGIYELEYGLEIGADFITVDGNGATLICSGECSDAISVYGHNYIEVKNFNISGFNAGVTVVASSDVNVRNVSISETHFGFLVDESNAVRINNNILYRVEANIAVEASTDITVEENVLTEPLTGAIGFTDCVDFEVLNNTIEDYNLILFTVYRSSSGLISGNVATWKDSDCGEIADVQFSNGIVFFGNSFEFFGDVESAEELRVLNSHDVWLVANMIKGNASRPGFKIMSGKGYETYNIYIVSNVLWQNHWGITLNQEGPQIINPQGQAEAGDLHDVYILRNLIYGAGNQGIFITYAAHDVKIAGNIIWGNEKGILMNEGATNIFLKNNFIVGNEVGVCYEDVTGNNEIADVVGWNSNSGIQFSSREIQAGNLLEDIKFIENGRDVTYYK